MEQSVKLEVTVNELNIILGGLAEMPLKFSGPVSAKLQKLASEQLSDVKQLPDAPQAD